MLAALVAVTEQVPAVEVANEVPVTVQLPVALKDSAPVPEPPEVVNAIGVPTVPLVVVLEIVNVA